jgi:hypothetical protein
MNKNDLNYSYTYKDNVIISKFCYVFRALCAKYMQRTQNWLVVHFDPKQTEIYTFIF